jgi:hypothetical protein
MQILEQYNFCTKGKTHRPKNFRDFMNEDAFIMYTVPIACKSYMTINRPIL